HRIVLRAPREDLDDAADLLVAAYDRVELPVLGELGQVAAELLQRLVGALGILRGDALAAADRLDLGLELVTRDDVEREQQVLGVELRVAHATRQFLRGRDGLLRLERQLVEVHDSSRWRSRELSS